jgi:uncharacterized protein YchJ
MQEARYEDGRREREFIAAVKADRQGEAELVERLGAASRRALEAGAQEVRQVKIGRNDPCPCGSGKKFKRCCISIVNQGPRSV